MVYDICKKIIKNDYCKQGKNLGQKCAQAIERIL